MEEILKNLLLNSHGAVAYIAVFGVLVACGIGLPLPEDISLLLGGFMVHQGAAHLPVMMAIGFCGILAGDSLIYNAGRHIGRNVGRQGGFFSRIVTPEKREKVEGLFGRHGQKIVMIARFLPGVRAVTYFTAGSAGMKYRWFIFWDGLAALVSAPLFVYVGFKFGDQLQWLIERVRQGEHVVIVAIVAAIVAYAGYRWLRTRALKRQRAEHLKRELAQAASAAVATPVKSVAAELPKAEAPKTEPSAGRGVSLEPGSTS